MLDVSAVQQVESVAQSAVLLGGEGGVVREHANAGTEAAFLTLAAE